MQAGIGRVDITPAEPIWLSGYAARTHPSEGAIGRLWAKALAIESAPGQRIVIVTTDVVGVPGSVTNEVAARVEKQFGVKRSQFFVNASHTHTGPVIWSNLNNLTVFPPDEQAKLEVYTRKFTDDLVAADRRRRPRPLARRPSSTAPGRRVSRRIAGSRLRPA